MPPRGQRGAASAHTFDQAQAFRANARTAAHRPICRSEQAQDIQNRLLVGHPEIVECIDDGVRFRAIGPMRLDGLVQIAGPAIVQKEDSLSNSPQRGRAE